MASAIVNPATEKTEGILLIELDPDSFSSMLLNNYNTYQNQYTFIIDKKWEVICSNKLIDSQWVDLIAAEFDRGNRRSGMPQTMPGWEPVTRISEPRWNMWKTCRRPILSRL